ARVNRLDIRASKVELTKPQEHAGGVVISRSHRVAVGIQAIPYDRVRPGIGTATQAHIAGFGIERTVTVDVDDNQIRAFQASVERYAAPYAFDTRTTRPDTHVLELGWLR